MTHPALATMVEAAKKATQGEWGLVRVTADNLWIDAPCPPDMKPEEHPNSRVSVTWDMSEEDAAHILATQPANILALDEYVRGLEDKAAAVIRADEEFRRHLPEGTERDPVTRACDELRAALGGKP